MNDEDILRFQEKFADLLKAARGQSAENQRVIQAYLDESCRLGLVTDEVTDFFCVSAQSIIEMAGCDVNEGDEIVTPCSKQLRTASAEPAALHQILGDQVVLPVAGLGRVVMAEVNGPTAEGHDGLAAGSVLTVGRELPGESRHGVFA